MSSLYGALAGDAFGVAYSGKHGVDIPDTPQFIMPASYSKSYPKIPYGVWSANSALLLGLLETGLLSRELSPERIMRAFVAWKNEGRHQWHREIFNEDTSVVMAVTSWQQKKQGFAVKSKSNGALTRSLSIALLSKVFKWDLSKTISFAICQAKLTHQDNEVPVCCVFYCLIAKFMLEGNSYKQALDKAALNLPLYASYHSQVPEISNLAVSRVLSFNDHQFVSGASHCTNSLWSALNALKAGTSFMHTMELAVDLGNDTSATAMLAGGLAGISFGVPADWLKEIRLPKESWQVINEFSNQVAKPFRQNKSR